MQAKFTNLKEHTLVGYNNLMKISEVINNSIIDKNGVYFIDKHSDFKYSDGDKIEEYIFEAIRNSKDISSESQELESYIKDWPSRYHLSRERVLAYKSLNIPPTANILEVGCGCGSITSYLGKRAEAVLALEGSPRRAAITRERTSNLKNVNVLCGSFEDVVFNKKFDIVICNGVFEYASLFVKNAEPYKKMLQSISSLVVPRGSLIIAIENKFGLRYFSSGKEEHTNIMFDGIEGYSTKPKGPCTYGATEIEVMLNAEFGSVETLLPLPDYKLPRALIRSDLLKKVNCAELFSNTMRHDFGSHVLPRMHERLVWHELQKNGLMKDFANSFFMIASDSPTSLFDPAWLGDIYSIRRKPEWAVRTRIYAVENGSVWTSKSLIHPEINKAAAVPFLHNTDERRWSNNASVHTTLVRALRRKDKLSLEERFRMPVLAWWAGIKKAFPVDNQMSGSVIDHNWQNTLMTEGDVIFIDCEWEWNGDIELSWLLYRVVATFTNEEIYFIHRWCKNCRGLSSYKIINLVAKIIGEKIDLASLFRAVEQEIQFQVAVTGCEISKKRMIINLFMPLIFQQILHLLKDLLEKISHKSYQFFDVKLLRKR